MQSCEQNVQAIPWVRGRLDLITTQSTAAAYARSATRTRSEALSVNPPRLLVNVLIPSGAGIGSVWRTKGSYGAEMRLEW